MMLPWERIISNSTVPSAAKLPNYRPRNAPSSKSRQLWLARNLPSRAINRNASAIADEQPEYAPQQATTPRWRLYLMSGKSWRGWRGLDGAAAIPSAAFRGGAVVPAQCGSQRPPHAGPLGSRLDAVQLGNHGPALLLHERRSRRMLRHCRRRCGAAWALITARSLPGIAGCTLRASVLTFAR